MTGLSPVDVRKALKGAGHPVGRDDLVAPARGNGADEKVVDRPSHAGTERFDGPDDLQKGLFDNA